MRWPPWLSSLEDDEEKARESASWTSRLNTKNWTQWTSPNTLIPTVVLTGTILFSYRFYRLYLRRIPLATNIKDSFWHKRSLFGTVTSVGDGDGFRLFHTPGGRLTGWGWLPWRKIPTGKELKDKTISVRLAGVDAPECAHFGRAAQPGSKEALDWLTEYVLGRRVRTYVYKRDQYNRAVGSVFVRRGLLRRDVGLQMLKMGLATVYEAKTGSEFGDFEEKYRRAEEKAKGRKKGIWAAKADFFESPREYKNRIGQTHEEIN